MLSENAIGHDNLEKMVFGLKRMVFKAGYWLIFFFCIMIVIEFSLFCFIWRIDNKSESADVIVIFNGSTNRIEKGLELANQGSATQMIISPGTNKYLIRLDKTYRKNKSFKYIVEDRAETTFQNALFVAGLIREHGIKTVLLVTSDYHMPRSYILLRLQLAGSGVSVRPCSVDSDSRGSSPLAWSMQQHKYIFNELIELWGSLAESIYYSISGRLRYGVQAHQSPHFHKKDGNWAKRLF